MITSGGNNPVQKPGNPSVDSWIATVATHTMWYNTNQVHSIGGWVGPQNWTARIWLAGIFT